MSLHVAQNALDEEAPRGPATALPAVRLPVRSAKCCCLAAVVADAAVWPADVQQQQRPPRPPLCGGGGGGEGANGEPTDPAVPPSP